MKSKKVYEYYAILKGERKYRMKIKEFLKDDRYLLIDGSIEDKDSILEIIKKEV